MRSGRGGAGNRGVVDDGGALLLFCHRVVGGRKVVSACFGLGIELVLLKQKLLHNVEDFGRDVTLVTRLITFFIRGGVTERVQPFVSANLVVWGRRIYQTLDRVRWEGRVA